MDAKVTSILGILCWYVIYSLVPSLAFPSQFRFQCGNLRGLINAGWCVIRIHFYRSCVVSLPGLILNIYRWCYLNLWTWFWWMTSWPTCDTICNFCSHKMCPACNLRISNVDEWRRMDMFWHVRSYCTGYKLIISTWLMCFCCYNCCFSLWFHANKYIRYLLIIIHLMKYNFTKKKKIENASSGPNWTP